MSKSLLEQLPGIVAAGKRQAAQILEQLEGRNRVTLQTRELVVPTKDTVSEDLFRGATGDGEVSNTPNRLIYGDNMLAMAALLAGDDDNPSLRGKIDLIYIDPPFDSKADYRTKITLPGTTIDQKPTVLEQFGYSDTWSDGTASYLAMITPRLVLMRELLSARGTIYVHLDWHVGHYVKLVLDDIFGKENFRNEIVWCYTGPSPARSDFPKKHDTIFRVAKTSEYYFDPDAIRIPYKATFTKVRGVHGKKDYEESAQIERHEKGKIPEDWWTVASNVSGWRDELLGYATQKPEALIERILKSSCPPGGTVADFFVGSGTTAAVAEKLGMNWIATDLGKPATMVTRKRLVDQDAKPFLYQAIGDYQVEQARSTLGRNFRVGDLATVVLDLFGALPLPPGENVNGSLGRLPNSRTLVFADSPSRLTTASTLRRAQGYRDSKLGGFDKVIVLGWNFVAGIGQDIADLNDDRLEVLVIPPDLLDRLKKKGVDRLTSEVRFASLQYLKAEVTAHRTSDHLDELRVNLANYVLLSPEAINLDEKNRLKLRHVMNSEPLALIEYWAIDPNYDGEVFRSVWQDYRGNVENDSDPLRVVTKARLNVPTCEGRRRVCVRAVDVFGLESEVVVDDVEVAR